MFLLIALFASSGYSGALVSGVVLQPFWILFDGFIAGLQAYIFMMLTVAYIAMAHEKH
jgi:F-type H+-transporting ATPase subunit a